MRLSIAGWPPLASHVSCLIGGLAIAHLTQSAHSETPKFPEKSFLVTLSGKDSGRLSSSGQLKKGTKVYAVRKSASGRCRLHDDSAQVLAVKPQLILALPLSAGSFLQIFGSKNSKQKAFFKVLPQSEDTAESWAFAEDGASLNLCDKPPQVIYGP